VVGIYYKREAIKKVSAKKPLQTSTFDVAPPSPAEPQRKGGNRPMD